MARKIPKEGTAQTSKPIVIHISSLPYYNIDPNSKAGMPSIRKPVEEFHKRGWVSIFLYPSKTKELPSIKNGVFLHPVHFPFELYPSFARRQATATNARENITFLHYFPSMLSSVFYVILFSLISLSMMRVYKPRLIYAHQNIAVIVADFVKHFSKVPFVARIYGFASYDILLGSKSSVGKFLKTIPSVTALKSNADLFVITDDGTRGVDVCKRFRISRDRYLVLRNAVDVPADAVQISKSEAKRRLNLNMEQPLIVFVGRLEGFKRIDRIVHAAEVAKECRRNWVFLLIGKGSDREVQENFVKNRGLDNVFFKGPVPHEDVFLYLRAADVFLALQDLSSLSNTLLEALAIGTPVVCSQIGNGIQSLVIPGVSGYLVKNADDSHEVIAAIEKVLNEQLSAEKIRDAVFISSWEKRLNEEFNHFQNLV
jgi:glycosyltransferase involved in cell wall biosynthesis